MKKREKHLLVVSHGPDGGGLLKWLGMTRPAARAAGLADRFFEVSLLGLVSSGFLAVAGSGALDLSTTVLTSAGLLLRAAHALRLVRFDVSSRAVALLTLAYAGFFAVDYLAISRNVLGATVHLICFLAVVKILTAKTSRDFVYVKIIAFLELLVASILSTSLTFFIFLVLFLLFAVATFASYGIRRATFAPQTVARGGLQRFHLRLATLSLVIAAGILSLTAGMFFLLPRTAHAAFVRLAPQRYHLPGFSNEVRLGEIGEILQQNTSVMHVRIVGKAPSFPLRWRGAVLDSFDGKRWYSPPAAGRPLRVDEGRLILASDEQRRRAGARVSYEIQLEPVTSDALFLTGVPEVLWINSPAVVRTKTGAYRLGYERSSGLRYAASSYIDPDLRAGSEGEWPPAASSVGPYLALPRLDARVRTLTGKIVAGSGSDEGKARSIALYLLRSYAYSTELPAIAAADPVPDFLFMRKQGHCEYFAASMAVMLRVAGIPSRVVTGFQGGVFNPISGWYVVRASDAHSWVEAWINGRGWTTYDPTPGGRAPARSGLRERLSLYMDAADMFWQDWVVGYDRERQLRLAAQMGDSGRGISARWLDRVRMAALAGRARVLDFVRRFGILLVGSAVVAWLLWVVVPRLSRRVWTVVRVRRARRGNAEASDATILYTRMLDLLRRRGFDKPPWLTPGEFADQLPASPTAELVLRITAAYNGLRFGGKLEAAPQIMVLLDELERTV